MPVDDSWKQTGSSDTWDFEKNKELQGVFLETREGVGSNNSKMHYVRTKDGERVGFWGSTVLDGRLQEVPVGSQIMIVYKGKQESEKRKGSQFKVFEVYYKDAEI